MIIAYTLCCRTVSDPILQANTVSMRSEKGPRSMPDIVPARSPALPILVVDDEDEIVNLLCAVLEDDGFRVLTAKNGADALTLIQQNPVALVLTDLMMPQGSGLDLARRLRGDPQTARIPIILMSAAMPRQVSQLFTHVIHKPFSIDVVIDMVHQLLAH